MTQSVPPPSSPESRPTADRILDAAEVCFARRGFDGTTLRDIAERVGIRIPSLYNHFDGKQSIYAAVLTRGLAPILQMLARAVEDDEPGGPPDPKGFVTEVMETLKAHPDLPRLMQYEMLAGGEKLALLLEGWLRPTMERGLELLHETPAALHWKPDELPFLQLALVNMLIGHFTMTPLVEQLLGHQPEQVLDIERATDFYARAASLLTFGGSPPTLQESLSPENIDPTDQEPST